MAYQVDQKRTEMVTVSKETPRIVSRTKENLCDLIANLIHNK